MKIDMTTQLLSLTNEPLEELERYDNPKFVSTEETPDEEPQHIKKKKVILRDICVGALLNTIDSDKGVSGVERNKWFVLSMKLQKEDEPYLLAEDIKLLKDRIGSIYKTLIVGRAYELLDPVEEPEEGK